MKSGGFVEGGGRHDLLNMTFPAMFFPGLSGSTRGSLTTVATVSRHNRVALRVDFFMGICSELCLGPKPRLVPSLSQL